MASKYGMPWILGTKATETSASPPPVPDSWAAFFWVQPTRVAAATTATIALVL
jgi:hypothetical protein